MLVASYDIWSSICYAENSNPSMSAIFTPMGGECKLYSVYFSALDTKPLVVCPGGGGSNNQWRLGICLCWGWATSSTLVIRFHRVQYLKVQLPKCVSLLRLWAKSCQLRIIENSFVYLNHERGSIATWKCHYVDINGLLQHVFRCWDKADRFWGIDSGNKVLKNIFVKNIALCRLPGV